MKKYIIYYSGILVAVLFSFCSPEKKDYKLFLESQAQFENNALKSTGFPKGSISFNPNVDYIGSETFILYNVASCEIHLFAELDTLGGFCKIYWIQYEGYLPSRLLSFPANLKPGGLKYSYSEDPDRTVINGKEFYVKTGLFPIEFTDCELRAQDSANDSDFTRVGRMLYQKGVNINGKVLSVRMVHLNPDNNKELMIIYYESIQRDSSKIEKLNKEGKDSPYWDEVSEELRERAMSGMQLFFE